MGASRRSWIGILVLLTVISAGGFLFWKYALPKRGFVNVDKVYEKFTMKTELEKKMQQMEEYQSFYVDSMKLQIRSIEAQLISQPEDKALESKLQQMYQQFQLLSKDFQERNNKVSEQYNKQVLDKIRAAMAVYRQEKNLESLIGKSESTDLIYYEDALDHTESFIEHLNANYVSTP